MALSAVKKTTGLDTVKQKKRRRLPKYGNHV